MFGKASRLGLSALARHGLAHAVLLALMLVGLAPALAQQGSTHVQHS